MEQIYQAIKKHGIVAIVRGVSIEKIVPLGNTFNEAGIKVMEITCNTPGVTEMIGKVSRQLKGRMYIGAGTVITKQLCEDVIQAGAQFVVAPDINPEVISYCIDKNIPVIPGAATPTEILTAKRLGATMVKIFPAGVLGTDYIRQLRGPIDDMDFVAVGKVTIDSIPEFISAGCVAVGLGSGLVRKNLVEAEDWPQLTEVVRQYVQKVNDWITP